MKKILLISCIFLTSCLRITLTSGEMANKITGLNRDIIHVRADLELKKQLKESINESIDSFLLLNTSKKLGYYDINIVEGRVLLTGSVREEMIKQIIEKKIKENIKVRELLSELIVSTTSKNHIKDYFIERMIKTKIFFKTKVRSMNYEISVMNGYVYIIGIANDEEELKLLTKAISTVRGVKEVVSYIITVDSDKKIKFIYN